MNRFGAVFLNIVGGAKSGDRPLCPPALGCEGLAQKWWRLGTERSVPTFRAIVMLGVITASAFAANWPTFRGPNGSGVAEGSAPTKWDATKNENILWKTPIPGLAHSSPVVWGAKVFITTAVSSDPAAVFRHGLYGDVEPSTDVSKHTWKVYCLDRDTGKIVWEQISHEGTPKTKRHPKSSQASSTPATDGKHVVASFGSEGLYTYDMNGKLLWKQDLGILQRGLVLRSRLRMGHR